jgi:hypothetical protein
MKRGSKDMERHPIRPWLATVVCLLLVGCGALGWVTDENPSGWHAVPMPEWEEAFQRADSRWRGADGSYSVPLSSSRTLWLFGDTWITKPEARGREKGRVIRNSVALQEIGGQGPGGIEFFWREGDEGPKAVFVPATGAGWLWPLSGERVGESLYLFFGQFIENDSKLGFESSGCWLLRVANPDEPPGAWEIEHFSVPFFEHTPNGDLSFGVGCISHEGFLYVYGIREDWSRGVEGRSLLVARAPFEALEEADFSEWRFFSGDSWTGDVSQCAPLFDGAATEMSVSYLPGRHHFLAVYTYCGLSEEILARRAPHPEGPWGRPMTLYRCPEVSWSEDYFCYAGKAHPELAEGHNQVVVTYAVNSWNINDHQTDLRLYWPRFVRVAEE